MSYVFRYSGFEVVKPLGEKPFLKIKIEASQEFFKKAFGGDYNFLLLLNHYNVKLFSSTRTPPFNLQKYITDVGTFRGFTQILLPGDAQSFLIDLEIPISKQLLDEVEKIRVEGNVPAFQITCNYSAFPLFYTAPRIMTPREDRVMKYSPDGKLCEYIALTTEEVDELFKKMDYVDILRIEFPIPKAPSPANEWLIKSIDALKSAHNELTEGNWDKCLYTCRNIIMNLLIPPLGPEKERKLREEIVKAVLGNAPEKMREEYKLILKGIEITLKENLEHVHKFVKETGELVAYASMKEAMFIYTMIANVIRYLCELSA